MFELNGEQYSLQQVEEAAKQSSMSLDDYVSEYGLIKMEDEGKTNGVADEGATVTPTTGQAPEVTELESVDISSESQPKRSVRGETRKKELEDRSVEDQEEKTTDDSNWENYDFIDDVGKRLKISLKSIEQGMTRLPAFVNEIKFAISKPFLSEEDKNYFDNLSTEEQQEFVNKIGGAQQLASSAIGLAQMPVDAQESLEKSEETRKELEELESELVQFDNTIAQDIADGNIGRATVRTASQAIAAIPSVVQAFIPYVGIPSIVLGEASKASGEAQRKGENISLKTIGYSSIIGASEGLLEIFTKKIGKSVYKSLVDKPKEVVEKNIKDLVLNVSKSAGSEGLSESGTLTINKLADAVILKDEKAFDNYMLELADTFIVGSAVGGPLRGTGEAGSMLVNAAESRSVNKELKNSKYENLTQAFEDPNVDEATVNLSENKYTEKFLDFDLKKKVESGELTTEQAAEIKNNFLQTQGAANSLKPLNLSTTDKAQVIDLVKEKKSLENTIKQVDDTALTEPQNQRVKEINNLLRDFSTKAIVQETAKVKSVLGGLKSVGVKEPMSTKEIENYLLKNNIAKDKSDAIKKSGQGALIFQDPDTKEQTIIVNKDIGNVADASHEGLHALIYETVRKSPDTAIRLGESLQQELNKIDPNLIEDLGIRERLELYNEDPSAVRAEEVLTLFSDTVRTGAFKFNENVFTKIGDVIRQFLSSIGVKAKFNNGRDVYNFIKDYQRSIEKGKLTRGQERAATEGATGRLVGPKIETFVETTTAKESRSEEASQRVQEIYDQQGTAGAFEIIEQFKPITSKLVERRSEAPGFDRQLLTDEIETGQRGIIDLISEYDPDSGVPLAAYINKFLPARAIEASNRVLSEEFTEDVTEARGVVAEEADVEVVEQPKGPKKPTETTRFSDTVLNNLGVKNKAEAEKQISDATNKAFKGQDVTRFGQTKNVPVAVAEIYGKMFGVNPETIYDKKRNYSKKDSEGLTRIKQYLIDNATSDFARLPKTKDDFGKATFIPNNVMNALYTDGELTGTLKDYLDLIREKPVKPIYRDRVGQTIRGLFNTSIRNRMVEDLIPSKPERARAGVKFAKVTKPKVRQNRFEVSGKNGIVIMRDNAEQFAKANNVTIEFEGETITAKNLDSKNPKHRAYVQQQIENELWKYFPLEAIDASTVVGYRDGFYFTKEEWAKTSERAKTNKAEWLARGNKLNYNLEAVKAAKAVKTPPKNKEYYSSDKFKNKLKNWKAGVKAILDGGADAIKADPNMYLPVYAIFSTQSQSSSHLVRNMSVERGASEAFINATKSTPTVKEHVEPSNEMAPLMYEAMLFDEVDVLMPVVDLIYYQLGITKTQDDKTLDVSGMYGDPYNYKTTQTDEFNEALREYFKTGDVDKILSPLIRYFNPQVNNNTSEDNIPGFNSNALIFEGKTVAEVYTKQLTKSEQNNDNLFYQNELTYQVLKGDITQQQAVERLNEFTKIKTLVKASKSNDGKLPPGIRLEDPKTFDKFDMANTVARRMFPKQANSDAVKSGRLTAYEALDPDQKFIVMQEVPGSPIVKQTIDLMATSDEAIKFSRNADAPDKGISVWDFDDTLATTKSNVLYTMPNGTEGTLTAEQFAKQGEQLLEEGAEFDFSEFEKVTKGAKGPMFEKAVARNRKFGNDNVFILTARTQAAAEPIHQFLKAIGLDIPLKNIVGLGNSTPEAKARWVVGKAAEGYNDFYFADDAYKNVKAVQDALNVLDVKSKVRQAYIKHSKSEALDKGFNDILEQTSSIASEKEYKKVKAEVAGASLGKVFRGIPYSAQDLVGLLYETLGKGKLGDSQMAWYKKHLLDPYARAVNDIDNARLSVMQDYRALKKQLGFVPKNLRKKLPGEPFTREQAVRVYIWNKLGYDVPGISNQDLKELSEYVADNADLQVFADQVIDIQKGEYAKPKEGWPAGTITTDIQESINTGVRAKYLTQWQNNVDVIFSEKNMNKLEAAYGKKYRKAMENMLGRMKTGRNRNFSDDSLTARFTDWLQGSIGAIMFFNSRSALLQNLSSINFLNFTDNNPLAAARAFSNQKQYWSDFSKLINSDFLKARRSGLRMNVNEADIADMAKKGGPRAVISKLLQFGFTPTQIADSFAIASGGATFYRNRIKTYTKQGLSQQEAEAKAFEDFRETAEESQQSARPDRISMQQAGPLGRLILAFQNTPSQYARIIDKSVRDLKNRRGDAKTNVSKIIYYATVQNLIFNALQQALFAFAFDDEEPEDEEKKEKYVNILNSMSDSLLRGTGVAGGVMSVTKNAIIRIVRESQKDNPNYEKVGADLQRIAPPVSSKLSKINQAARSFKWDKDEMINGGWGLDNPAYLAVGNVVSATTNIPMDRGVKKINNLMKASDSELETWERLALLGGWQDWEIGIDDEEKKKKPQDKQNKKESKLIKSKIRKSKTK